MTVSHLALIGSDIYCATQSKLQESEIFVCQNHVDTYLLYKK